MVKPIGVLSLQGDFAEHITALKSASFECKEVRSIKDLESCFGLVIPGGESTTIGKLLSLTGLNLEIKRRFKSGDLKIWGTCAGAILCASRVVSSNPVQSLDLGDYSIARNAYGNQLDSFATVLDFNDEFKVDCAFIRAPQIKDLGGENWKILARHNEKPVFAINENLLISTCHPELYENVEFYEWLKKWFFERS